MRNTIKNIWHREREGSSLVTVIIGILFIAAIGTIRMHGMKAKWERSRTVTFPF